jgi:hypothetical protein
MMRKKGRGGCGQVEIHFVLSKSAIIPISDGGDMNGHGTWGRVWEIGKIGKCPTSWK